MIKFPLWLALAGFFLFSGSAFAQTLSEAFQSCRSNANSAYNGNVNFYVGSTCTVQGNAVNFLLGSNGSNQGTFPFVACASGTQPTITGSATVFIPAGTTAACAAPPIVQNCPAGQYKNSFNVCVAQPDCNIGFSTGGHYFDVVDRVCKTASPINLCLGDTRTIDCPPIDDCIAPGVLCSNNAADVDVANAAQPAANAAAKAAATNSKDTAVSASSDAAAASAAKAAASDAAQQTADAANSQAQSQQAADPTSQATIDALNAAAAAAAEAAAAAAKASGSAESAALALSQSTRATGDYDGITPSLMGGRSWNYADDAAAAAAAAVAAAIDAIQGQAPDGSPGGTGENMGSCPDCAKESTLQSMLNGTADTPQTHTQDQFDDALPTDAAVAAKAEYQAQFDSIKSQLSTMFSFAPAGTGELPSFDFGTIKGKHVVVDMSVYSTQLAYVGLTILFAAAVIAVMIFLG